MLPATFTLSAQVVAVAGVAPGVQNSELSGPPLDLERLFFLGSEQRLDLEHHGERYHITILERADGVCGSPATVGGDVSTGRLRLAWYLIGRCAALLSTGSSAGSNLPAKIVLVILGYIGNLTSIRVSVMGEGHIGQLGLAGPTPRYGLPRT
ncbi:hypothetical protein MRX96_057575 [Rhipicephalus microplus]